MGLFKTLAIIVIVYYVFRLITRTFLPYFAKRYVNKAQEKFYEQNPHINPDEAKSKEGEVNVKSKPQSTSKTKEALGDYVDFEEVEE